MPDIHSDPVTLKYNEPTTVQEAMEWEAGCDIGRAAAETIRILKDEVHRLTVACPHCQSPPLRSNGDSVSCVNGHFWNVP